MRLKIIAALLVVAVVFTLGTYFVRPSKNFKLIAATMAKEVNDKFRPQGITGVFPAETATVYCWFEWMDAKLDTSIMASWHYTTDDIHILDYSFNIPRKGGSGSVSLSMPPGKILPAGAYRIDLKHASRVLKMLTFRILEKS